MAETVKSILRGVARKLLLARAAEASAAAAIAAAGASALLMSAWVLAGRHAAWATALALGPWVSLVLVLPAAARRRLGRLGQWIDGWDLSAAVRWVVVICSALAAAAGVALVLSQEFVRIPHWLIPLVLVPAGGLAAVATVLARGVSLAEAALYVDRRGNFGERLTTALELEEADGASPFLPAVSEQAVRLARGRAGRLRFWRRTRVTPGVLALAALACGVLTLVSPFEAPGLVERRQWEEVRKQQAAELQARAEELARKAEQLDSPQLKRTAEEMQKISNELRWGQDLPPERAAGQIGRMQRELESAMAKQQALSDAVDALKRFKPTEALAHSGHDPAKAPESAAADMSKAMAEGAMSADQQQELRDSLRGAADAAAADPALAGALREAARAIDERNAEAFAEAMAQAGSAMGGSKQQAGSGAGQAMADAMNDLEQQKQSIAAGGGLTREDYESALAQAGGGDGQGGGRGGQSGPGGQQGNGSQGGSQGSGQAGAGQQGSGGPGQQGGGQGNTQQGGGQGGNGGGPGGGNAGPGGAIAGGGSTNLDQGSGPGGRSENDSYQHGRWARVYAPRAIESEGATERVTGMPNEDGTPVERAPFYAPAEAGQSYVPYDKAWAAARSRAEQNISKQRIPARLRKLIQDYYMLDE